MKKIRTCPAWPSNAETAYRSAKQRTSDGRMGHIVSTDASIPHVNKITVCLGPFRASSYQRAEGVQAVTVRQSLTEPTTKGPNSKHVETSKIIETQATKRKKNCKDSMDLHPLITFLVSCRHTVQQHFVLYTAKGHSPAPHSCLEIDDDQMVMGTIHFTLLVIIPIGIPSFPFLTSPKKKKSPQVQWGPGCKHSSVGIRSEDLAPKKSSKPPGGFGEHHSIHGSLIVPDSRQKDQAKRLTVHCTGHWSHLQNLLGTPV